MSDESLGRVLSLGLVAFTRWNRRGILVGVCDMGGGGGVVASIFASDGDWRSWTRGKVWVEGEPAIVGRFALTLS